MSIIINLESILSKVKEIGYWKLAIPSKLDYEILKNIESYRKLIKSEKDILKNDMTIEATRLLLYFSERMATFALRSNDQNIFNNGLYALDVTCGKLDLSEILINLSLYYDVTKKNSLTFDEFIKSKEDLTGILLSFLGRKDDDKSIESMGYVVEADEMNQLIYKRTW